MAQFEVYGKVSKKRIAGYFEEVIEAGQEVRALLIEREDKLLVRASMAPYDCTDVRENYSVSKSFTSMAIGLLIGDGLLRVTDRLCDLIPERIPADCDERVKKLTLDDLLSMKDGHDGDSMHSMARAEDAVAAFCRHPITFEPGTTFRYDTGASCVLGCIVEKFAGMPMLDFLGDRLFYPMGIRRVAENRTADGSPEGGIGFHLCADDLLKFGHLLLHRGEWNGKQLVPADYIDLATKKHSDTAGLWENVDSQIGYCYQFWRNSAGGYRADGSLGQFVLVFPDTNTVAVLQSEAEDVQKILDPVFALLETLEDGEPEDAEAPAFAPAPLTPLPDCDGIYSLEPNRFGFTRLYITAEQDRLVLTFSDGTAFSSLSAGRGIYCDSVLAVPYFKPKLYTVMRDDRPEPVLVSACCEAADGGIGLILRHRSVPQKEKWILTTRQGALSLDSADPEPPRAEHALLRGKKIG